MSLRKAVFTAAKSHTAEFIADVSKPGPNGKIFVPAGYVAAAASVSSQLTMFDGVTVADLPAGFSAYAGYYNGAFANLTALRERFPHATIVSITPSGEHGAMFFDIEPGDGVNSEIAAFLKAGGVGFYTAGSNVAAAIAECSNAGIPRDTYRVWSAHWIGSHVCAPDTCGYPQSDGTQYESTADWDASLLSSSGFFTKPSSGPDFPIKAGSPAAYILDVQKRLNTWAKEIKLVEGLQGTGTFDAATAAAVKLALEYWDYSAVNVALDEVDESLWNHLNGTPPVASWAYEAPQSLTAKAGNTSVKLSWKAPSGSVPSPAEGYHAPSGYVIAMYSAKGEVASYPRRNVTETTIQVGSLPRRTALYARVWAEGAPQFSSGHYAQVDFVTG